MKKYSSDSAINNMVKKFIRLGWSHVKGGKHGKLRSPTGDIRLVVPSTPGDWRASRQFRADLRRQLRQMGYTDSF
ncbi:MAG: hypothetical protein LAT61_09825 [Alcanivorax sp.]|nr:hypothetical protein [Alcanivorax sp.]